jgi:hypothetical protein
MERRNECHSGIMYSILYPVARMKCRKIFAARIAGSRPVGGMADIRGKDFTGEQENRRIRLYGYLAASAAALIAAGVFAFSPQRCCRISVSSGLIFYT